MVIAGDGEDDGGRMGRGDWEWGGSWWEDGEG